MHKHYLFEDNAGGLHLAVLLNGECVYYFVTSDEAQMALAVAELIMGRDPISDNWDGGEENPDMRYSEIIEQVNKHNGGVQEMDDRHFLAYYITSFANGSIE